MSHETIEAPSGARLAHFRRDVERPRAVLCVQHGMSEHAARYGRFQDALAERGYASVAHDHRGHGATEADNPVPLHFGPGGWDAVVEDAAHVAREAAGRHEGAPLVAFGHSMGGIVAMNLALRHTELFAGTAIWNIGFRQGPMGLALRALLKIERLRLGSDVPSPTVRRLTFKAFNKRFAPNRTEADWLSRDEAEVDAYVADPKCGGPPTVGMWIDVTKGIRRAADDEPLALLPKAMPFHLLGGAKDPVTDGGAATRTLERRLGEAGLTDVTATVLDNTRHEALNEVNRDTTTDAFIGWLDARFLARD